MGQMNRKLDEHAAARQQEHERQGQCYQELRDLILTQFTELKELSVRESARIVTERSRRIAQRERSIQKNQQISRTLLLNLLLDRKRERYTLPSPLQPRITDHSHCTEMEARIAHLETQLQHPLPPTPLLTLDHFCSILAVPLPSRPPPSRHRSQSTHLHPLHATFHHPTADLSLALAGQETWPLPAQSQVQSI
jgi:hypothetical protein